MALENLAIGSRKEALHHDLKALLENFDVGWLMSQPPSSTHVSEEWVRSWTYVFRERYFELVSCLGSEGESLSLFLQDGLVFTF